MSKGKINETGASGIIRQIVGNAPDNQRKSMVTWLVLVVK